MKNVLIINEGFSHNLGDQAIKKAIEAFFIDAKYSTDFLYFLSPKTTSLPAYDYTKKIIQQKKTGLAKLKTSIYFFYWLFINHKTIINKLKTNNYSIVAIGGGQLLNSSGSSYPHGFAIALYWLTYLIKKHTSAKIILIAVGAATNYNRIEKTLYAKAFSKIEDFFVRDVFSKQKLKDQFHINAQLMPDIAFYESKSEQAKTYHKDHLALLSVTNYDEVVAKYNEQGVSKDQYFEQLYKVLQRYFLDGFDVKLFYTTISDSNECINFKQFVQQQYQVTIEICDIQTYNDLTNYLAKAKIVYSGRMHALILGLKFDCKTEAYIVSQKLRSFNEEYIKGVKSPKMLSKDIETILAKYIN